MSKKIFKREYFCCNITAECEIFETGVVLYDSIAKLKKKTKCWKKCGIAKVTIFAETLVKGKY